MKDVPMLELTHIRPISIGVVESILLMDSNMMLRTVVDRYVVTSLDGDDGNYQCAIYDLLRSDIERNDELLPKLKNLELKFPDRLGKLIHDDDENIKKKLTVVIEFVFDRVVDNEYLDITYLNFTDSSFQSIVMSTLRDNFIIQNESINGIRHTVRVSKRKE